MINNYLKIAIRTLLRFKGFAIINLFGLSLGLAAGVMIMLFVADELSFDQFHAKKDRTYRVLTQFYAEGEGNVKGGSEGNAWPIGDILRREFPEVESVAYMPGAPYLMINQGDKKLRQKIIFSSPDFLNIFSFPLIKGNASTALNDPWSIIITEEMEKKYFPGGDGFNKHLIMNDTMNFIVTGILKDIPQNSHIRVDMVASFATYQTLNSDFDFNSGWGNINMRNYVLLKEGTDTKAFFAKAKTLYTDRAADMLKDWGSKGNVVFEPMPDIYLKSESSNGLGSLGSIDRVYLVSGIAIFVIVLACINFVNLATARSVYRAKEVGLRKVSGSSRMGLVRQFITEAFVLTLMSFILAIAVTWLFLPSFNELMQKTYKLTSFFDPLMIGGTLTLLIVIAGLAGFYPALVMSSMNPVEVLKGRVQSSARGIQLRRSLVIFQFLISSTLATGTLIVVGQLDYMQKQRLGFSKDNVIVINVSRAQPASSTGFQTFKDQISALAFVDNVSFTNALPGVPGWDGQIAYPEGRSGDEAVSVQYMAVDADYVETMGLEMAHGRNFDALREMDIKDGLIINEAAAKIMGWEPSEAVGKRIESPSKHPAGEVIGVVKDYHHEGLQETIGPVTMDYNPERCYLFAVRYKAADTQQMLESLTSLWKQDFPASEFNYFFLDETFDKQYQSEEKLARVFALFAMITVAIAAIGLLGLVSFMIVARTKEIGVRKVLGAGSLGIIGLLSKEFVILVTIANVIAVPIAWYFANEWLSGFAFRMGIDPMLFIGTTLSAIALTLLTVGYQTFRAAQTNPVKALRYE